MRRLDQLLLRRGVELSGNNSSSYLGTLAGVELPKDVPNVHFDSALADEESVGNGAIRVSMGDQISDLELPFR